MYKGSVTTTYLKALTINQAESVLFSAGYKMTEMEVKQHTSPSVLEVYYGYERKKPYDYHYFRAKIDEHTNKYIYKEWDGELI